MAMQAMFRKLGKNWSHCIKVLSQYLSGRTKTNHKKAIIRAILAVRDQSLDVQSTRVGTWFYNNSFGVNL